MPNCRNVYITIDDFATLQGLGRHYEGFVVGLGYAYVLSAAIPPPSQNGYTRAGNVPPEHNRFSLIRGQCVDNSPEMIKQSLTGFVRAAQFHTVQHGDTLTAIAQRYRVSIDDLIKWNQLRDPDRIDVGQKLAVSEKSRDLLGDYLSAQQTFPVNNLPQNSYTNNNPILFPSSRTQILGRTMSKEWSFPAMAAAGTTAGIVQQLYYSERYGTWMGKNFKLYRQSWGGNGAVGGKVKFGRRVANRVKYIGWVIGMKNADNIRKQYNESQIGTYQFLAEEATNAYSTFGGAYGIAWGIGWELGREITHIDAYQEFKFNTWYNYTEKRIGKPSIHNEHLWKEFFENYRP